MPDSDSTRNITLEISRQRGPAGADGTDASVTAENITAAGGALLTDLSSHTGNTSNPHAVTASQVGLGNVNNTSDANKPVSTAQAAADLAAATSPANTLTALEAMVAEQQAGARAALKTRSLVAPFWKPLKRISVYQDSGKPIVVRSLTGGDSWALNSTTGLTAALGNYGQIVGPSSCDKTATTSGNVKVTDYFLSYSKTPFEGRYINMTGAGNVIWGPGAGANRFDATGRVVVVMYERVSGGGIFSVEYETSTAGTFTAVGVTGTYQAASGTGSLPVVSQVNTGSGAGTSEFAIALFVLPAAITTRIRCTYVSGTANVYAAGVVGSIDLEPVAGTARQGHVDCNMAIGQNRLEYYNDVPQATWNTLLGWLKPDLVFFRELTEVSAATWQSEFEELMPKLSTAYSQSALILPGSHPTDVTREPTNDVLDAYLENYANANNALFIPMRQFFPSHADYVAMGLGDDVHMTTATNRYAEKVIWDFMMPFRYFSLEGSTGAPGGLRPMGDGLSTNRFFVTHDTSRPSQTASIGIRNKGSGTDNYGLVFEYRAVAPGGSYSWQVFGSDSNSFTYFDSINRGIYGPTSAPTRVPGHPGASNNGAHYEFYGNNTGLVALSLQVQTAQSVNAFEVRKGASTSAGGTLVAGYSKLGIPFASLDSYANDAAADADANLPSGGFYKITGSRAIYQK